MSDEVIGSAAKQLPARTALPWLVGAGVYVLLLALGPQLLNDPDSYSHIAVGRWIIAHGAVPASDPFSFSMHGAPWITFEWLSEIIYAAVYAHSGWNGVVALAAAVAALAVGLLTRFLLRELVARRRGVEQQREHTVQEPRRAVECGDIAVERQIAGAELQRLGRRRRRRLCRPDRCQGGSCPHSYQNGEAQERAPILLSPEQDGAGYRDERTLQ